MALLIRACAAVPGLAVAAALAAALAAGCYDPVLRDCTLTCSGPDECAAGQVCGRDGLCASPSIAGTCRARPSPDAAPDAGPAPLAALHVQIAGPGTVTVAPPGVTCRPAAAPGACDYAVPVGQTLTLTAIASKADQPFHDWSGACAAQDATCVLVATTAPLTVKATFAKTDH